MTVAQLNGLDADAFVATVGPIFEHSPWIAAAAAARRPFADFDALFAGMVSVLYEATPDRRLALIVAHPDLAGRVAREGRLTAASAGEQGAAGLDRLSVDALARFERLNAAYREKFAFPFVICAREHTAASILDAMESRIANARETEIDAALREIKKIAHLRLLDIVEN